MYKETTQQQKFLNNKLLHVNNEFFEEVRIDKWIKFIDVDGNITDHCLVSLESRHDTSASKIIRKKFSFTFYVKKF